MSLEKEYYVTIAMDLIAVLLLLGLCAVPKDNNEKDGTGRRLFAAAKDYAAVKGYQFIQVKTVRSGSPCSMPLTGTISRN